MNSRAMRANSCHEFKCCTKFAHVCIHRNHSVFFWYGGFTLLLSLESRAVESSSVTGQYILTVDALYRRIKGLSLILLVFSWRHWKYFANVQPRRAVLSKEFLKRTETIRDYGHYKWHGCGVLRLKPKLEFYSGFVNVLKCFAEAVWRFTVQGFTCLQIKRGRVGPNSCLVVFCSEAHNLYYEAKPLFWVHD